MFKCSNYGQKVIFHLFQDILAAILKGALHLEFSRILKIYYMLFIASYCLFHTNLIFIFKKHFLIILVFKLWPKW